MRRDIASAYAAAVARIASWIIISAFVYRRSGADAFGMLALVRATLGLLNYTTIGLAPAMIHLLPRGARRSDRSKANATSPAGEIPLPLEGVGESVPRTLDHARNEEPDGSVNRLYCNGIALAWAAAILGIALLLAYEVWFQRRHRNVPLVSPGELRILLVAMGIGTILRLAGDPASALLQIRGRLTFDNAMLASAELLWTALVLLGAGTLRQVGLAFALSSALLFIARSAWGYRLTGIVLPRMDQIRLSIMRSLLAFGIVVTLAQVADFLYAPTDYILIDRLLRPIDLATYAPAVQIDGGLLLLVAALASVILPRASLAHAAGDRAALKRYYLRGTAASAALLSAASLCVWFEAPAIFRIWLGNPMPLTQAILPFVLINTVIGGSSAIGRSILLGAGLVRPFAASVLIAGISNVICSYAFVRFGHAGLRGIVLGTSVAVFGRCIIWTPWYVMNTLGNRPELRDALPAPLATE